MSTSEVVEEDQLLLVNRLLPQEVGLFKHKVVHTCLDATEVHLAVGSEQGNFWVVDMKARRMLLKEVTDSRVPVCRIGLNPSHSFVATGNKEGVVEVTNYLKPLIHEAVYEKACRPVSALCWDQHGNKLFVGFDSGKLLAFEVDTSKLQLRSTPLLECEAEVVQLSSYKGLLLISTMAQSLLLSIDTGIANQVGSKERKPGKYGGCFLSNGDLMVARPGLRLWKGNQLGKVQSTAKFREALESQLLPTIAFYGNIVRPVQVQKGCQFTLLQPLADRYLVSFHSNTLLVVEPETLLCVGAMSLGAEIVGVATSGRHIFALCIGHQRPVVKLSLPAPQEQRLPPVPTLGYTHPSCNSPQNRSPTDHIEKECDALVAGEKVEEDVDSLDSSLSISTPTTLSLINYPQEADAMPTASQSREIPSVRQSSNVPSSDSVSPSSQVADRPMLLLTAVEAKLQHMADKYLGKKGEQQETENVTPIPAVVVSALSSEEVDRRTKMMGVVDKDEEEDDDDIAVSAAVKKSKKPRKNKTRRRKKPSPASSGATTPLQMFASLEGASGSVEGLPEAVAAEGSDKSLSALAVSEAAKSIVPLCQNDWEKKQDTQFGAPLAGEDERENKWNDNSVALLAREDKWESKWDTNPGAPLDQENNDDKQKQNACPGMSPAWEMYMDNQDADLGTSLTIESVDERQIKQAMKPKEGEVSELAVEPTLLVSFQSENSLEKQHSQDESSSSMLSQHSLPSFATSSSPEQQHHPLAVNTYSASYPSSETGHQSLTVLLKDTPLGNNMEEPLLEQSIVPESNSKYSSQQSPLQVRLRSNAFRSPSPPGIDEQSPGDKQASKLQQKGEEEKEKPLTTEASSLAGGVPEEGLNNKREISTSLHSLEQTDSESDEESDRPPQSGVASEYQSLVETLVRQGRHTTATCRPSSHQHQQASSAYAYGRVGSSLPSTPAATADSQSQEIWIPLPQPGAYHIQSICLSPSTLWLTDSRGHVYCTRAGSGAQNWSPINRHMSQVSSSLSGKVVWGLRHNQAYVRQGISSLNPSGSVWLPLTKTNSHIKWIACDEAAVWAVETDGRVMHRMGVSEGQPHGNIWHQLAHQGISLVSVACCNNIVWALDSSGAAYVRDKITPLDPTGKAWRCIWSPPSLAMVSIVESELVWALDLSNRLWFRCGVTKTRPDGEGPWWEVSVNSEDKSTSIPPWKVMAVERPSSFLTSLISSHHKQGSVSACSRAGVCVLTSDGQLHACWKVATGYHYVTACSNDLFGLSNWKKVGAGSSRPWVVREDGELYCIISKEKAIRVECQGPTEVLATSPTAIWVFSNGEIWSRQVTTKEVIQGISWEYIERGSHMFEAQIKALAIGKRAVWAIDNLGLVHFRFGVHPREPGTGMSPAWVPVEGHAQPLCHICVSPDDWLVWALDNNHNAYVRKGVTPDFPVGRRWEVVPGQQLKDVSASCGKVFALSVSGELLSRQGVSESNPAGNYWQRLPGSFEQVSTSSEGELWAIDSKGHVVHQQSKTIDLCLGRSRQEELESCLSDIGWEVL